LLEQSDAIMRTDSTRSRCAFDDDPYPVLLPVVPDVVPPVVPEVVLVDELELDESRWPVTSIL